MLAFHNQPAFFTNTQSKFAPVVLLKSSNLGGEWPLLFGGAIVPEEISSEKSLLHRIFLYRVPGPPYLEGPLKGTVAAQKTLQRFETKTGEFLGGAKEKNILSDKG